jgi:integrase
MAVYKDGDKWRVIYRYTNYKGERKQTQKRGFVTKREAVAWEHEVMLRSESKLDMTFSSFFEIYEEDKKKRVKENTWESKSHIIRTKILPFFGERKIAEIEPKDVIAWQNELLAYKGENGEEYSPTYLKTIHSQLSAIFNHAVRYYHLPSNPAQKAGSMGSEEHKEMLFWTKEEYLKFADAMMDKPISYYAFEMLYWTGIRCGELLALTPKDFNFERQELIINKSYQRLNGRDVITTPKTKKSNRTIKMPKFLCEEMREYIDMLYEIGEDERLFQITKSYLHHEMDRGAKIAGVKRIRIHDLRHSAISLLIEMGFSALAIAERVGHESIDITYRYAHLFPTKQTEMADKLDAERMEAIWMKPDSFGAAVKSFPRARYMSVIFLPSRTVGLRETAFFMK